MLSLKLPTFKRAYKATQASERDKAVSHLQDIAISELSLFKFTPDVSDLQRSEFQRVFVYGEDKKGYRAHPLLDERHAIRDSICYTDRMLVLWRKKAGFASRAIATAGTGTFPSASWNSPEMLRIQGELYVIQSPFLSLLDTYYQNGVQFERTRVRILRPWYHLFRTQNKNVFKARGLVTYLRGCDSYDAWMYIAKDSYWENQIHFGIHNKNQHSLYTPVKTFTSEASPWLNNYYCFTNTEF